MLRGWMVLGVMAGVTALGVGCGSSGDDGDTGGETTSTSSGGGSCPTQAKGTVGNKITFWSWEDIGMALLNLNSVIKLELYSGSVTPSDADAGIVRPAGASARLPDEEENLGRSRNKEFNEGGFSSPIVTQF